MDRQKTDMLLAVVILVVILTDESVGMSPSEKNTWKVKVLEMFDHAYDNYMTRAYPADELMPLSCKGRHRGTEPNRGDIDDSLGNFTLSLIDTIDTLAVLGKIEELEEAVRLVIRDSKFDTDVIVSVFETNIRVLGGLLGGHVVASYLKKKGKALLWYNSELLEKAREVGNRLLPAFNTTTGIPYPRINLRKGMADGALSQKTDTCTACAGTMLLEFAALSRLTGDPIYEDKARKAMDYLWQQRHRTSDLMGLVINIQNGDWIRRESGVGAGIDSYYEYVLKSYILLGDEIYLERFNKHYDAVMRYVSQGPLLIDVHMHKPMAASRNFMDALLAFWPGLQVLKGDIRPAIETHEMLYQIIQRHNFLPEAFTTDFRIHWGHHPLRPEFVESTYFLYKATGDPHYLEVGKQVVENLDKLARVPCGFAAIKDITTNRHEDQMDSYVLAETFKYLYLLFAENEDMVLDIDDYIFTTEAHLLPLSLSVHNNTQTPKIRMEDYQNLEKRYSAEAATDATDVSDADWEEDDEHNTCPNFHVQVPGGLAYAESLRSQMKDMVDRVHPRPRRVYERLRATEFIAGNKHHLDILHQMGIRIATMSDGRIQLLHTASEAASPEDAEDGMKFMQEMIELSKTQSPEAQHDPMYVQLISEPFIGSVYYRAGPAQFGYDLKVSPPVQGKLAISSPFKACSSLTNAKTVEGKIALLERGDCMFVEKARNLQKAGAIGGIVLDQTDGSTSDTQTLFAMSGDGQADIMIPLVFLFKKEGTEVIRALTQDNDLVVMLTKQAKTMESLQKPLDVPSGPGVDDNMPQSVPPVHKPPWDGAAVGEKMGLDEIYSYQSSSRKVRMEIKVNGETDTEPAVQEEGSTSTNQDALKLDVLPDGSRQLSFTVDKPTESQNQPQLNQIYVNLVQALQETTNFQKLSDQGDYLIAIARFLESAYFGMNRADNKAEELFESLAQKLELLKKRSTETSKGDGNLKKDYMDFETAKKLHYANTEHIPDSTSESSDIPGTRYVQTKHADKASKGFGAQVDNQGVLTFAVDEYDSAAVLQENVDGKRSDSENTVHVKVSPPLEMESTISMKERVTLANHDRTSQEDDAHFIEIFTEKGVTRIQEKNVKGEVIRTKESSGDISSTKDGKTSQQEVHISEPSSKKRDEL